MAGRDSTRPQLEFPALVAELIDQLRLTGQVGRLNFSDEVIPAFLIGSRGINFGGDLPAFASAAIFSGSFSNPAANTILADTGPLAAGTYDVQGSLSMAGTVAAGSGVFILEHRNAANNATLARLIDLIITPTHQQSGVLLPLMGYVLSLNERLRAISPAQAVANGGLSSIIYAQIRPTP